MRPRTVLLALALLPLAAAPGPATDIWPDVVLRHPAHPETAERDLNPMWFGDWRAPDGRTVAVTADAFTFHDAAGANERAVWLRHPYDWAWARGIQEKIAAGERPAGIGPGSYIGYAPPSVTNGDIARDLDSARTFLRSQKRLDDDAGRAIDTLKSMAGSIHPGTYRRVMRFCFDAPNAAADCAPVDLLSYYILDGDRLIEIDLPLVAPNEGKIIFFARADAGPKR